MLSDFSCAAWSSSDGVTTDLASVVVEFLSQSSVVLDAYMSGNLTAHNTWVVLTDGRPIPPLTRTIRVRLKGSRTTGSSTEALFDDASLNLIVVDSVEPHVTSDSWGYIKAPYRSRR